MRFRASIAAFAVLLPIVAAPVAAQDPDPRDRVFYTYNYYSNVPILPDGSARPGLARTFFDGLYGSLGVQGSFLGGSTARDQDCRLPVALLGCEGSVRFDGSAGAGFRIELGSYLGPVRVYSSFQGNYGFTLRGSEQRPFVVSDTIFEASARSHTLLFGAALDSAVVFPRLLPPRVNVYVQGGIGPTWFTVGDLTATGGFGRMTLPGAHAPAWAARSASACNMPSPPASS